MFLQEAEEASVFGRSSPGGWSHVAQ